MAFDFSGLTAYVKENQFKLFTASVYGSKMFDNATIVEGVKGTTKLPILAQSIFFQNDATCGFNASGDTTVTQRELVPGKIKVNLQWCAKDIEAYYFREQMALGAHKEDLKPIEEDLIPYIQALIAQNVEAAIWKSRITAAGGGIGSTVPMGTGNNMFFDGLRYQIQDNTGGYIDANSTSIYDGSAIASFTVSTMIEACLRIYTALGNNGLTGHDDSIVFMGYDKYTALVSALIAGGSTYGSVINSGVNGTSDTTAATGLTFPGTNLKVLPVYGLNSVNAIYGIRKSNLFLGVDKADDYKNMRMWYSEDDDVVRMAAQFKLGTQVAFPSEVAAIVL